MVKRSVFALTLGASLLIGGLVQARDPEVVGVVTNVDPNRLEIQTNGHETSTVTLNADTTYLKWLMAKPWQQDLRTSIRALRAGRRVHVDLAPGAQRTAKTVWIVTGRPGFE